MKMRTPLTANKKCGSYLHHNFSSCPNYLLEAYNPSSKYNIFSNYAGKGALTFHLKWL